MKKEAMNVKECKEGYMDESCGRGRKREIIYIIIKIKINTLKIKIKGVRRG